MLVLGCRQNMKGMETKRARGKCIANALACQLCWTFLFSSVRHACLCRAECWQLVYQHTEKGGKLRIDGRNVFRQYHIGPCSNFNSVLFGGLNPRSTGKPLKASFRFFLIWTRNAGVTLKCSSWNPPPWGESEWAVNGTSALILNGIHNLNIYNKPVGDMVRSLVWVSANIVVVRIC